jgi:putative ABC transport system ATP-binding protein
MISVEHVTKTYQQGTRQTQVLRGVNCVIPKGAFAFVVGPSGSGKSTLLYLMGALDQPTSGEIRINETPLNSMTPSARDRFRRNDVGFIFQSFNLLKNLSAVDNVLVPFLPEGVSPERRREAVELLKRVGLGDRLDHAPSQLSGGEQQRVAIARAVLKKPLVILGDEPTGELDSQTGARVFELLRELQEEHGTTVVTVTHDHRYFRESDLVLRMQDGQFLEANS